MTTMREIRPPHSHASLRNQGNPEIQEVGPMPVPQVEEPERFPGCADALSDRLGYGEITTLPLGVDLPTSPAGQPSGDEDPTAPDDE